MQLSEPFEPFAPLAWPFTTGASSGVGHMIVDVVQVNQSIDKSVGRKCSVDVRARYSAA